MDIIDLEAIPTHDIISRLLEVPFFQDIQNFSLKQFNTILDHTKLVELDVGDVLLVHGQKNEYLYVLLEGRLDVFQDKPQENKALGKIVGAQIFGALGAINQEPRTATIAASRTEPAKILSINYGIFGDLDDFSHISLRTKVLLYTVVANNLRFKLKCIQRDSGHQHLTNSFVDELPSKYRKNSMGQLQALSIQTKRLGYILELSNKESVPTVDLPKISTHKRFFCSIRNLFSHSDKLTMH